MKEEQQDITNTVIQSEKKQTFSPIILVALIGAVVLVIAFWMWQFINDGMITFKEDPANLAVFLDKNDFMIGDMGQVRVMFDADGNGPGAAVDVTLQSKLSSENIAIAEVADIVALKGQLLTHAKGTGVIVAEYYGRTAKTDVIVKNPKLEITCAGIPAKAKVGETVTWLLLLKEKGVPNYAYSWSGTGGVVGNEAMHTISYNTPGHKDASIEIVDMVGNTARADCFVTVTK